MEIMTNLMKIPERINQKLIKNEMDALKIIEESEKHISSFSTNDISLQYKISAPIPELTPEERAQSMTFAFRYDHLAEVTNFTIGDHNGNYYINEIDDLRASLNEYRTIFFNQKDQIYYQKISNMYRKKLLNIDSSLGLSITVFNKKRINVTTDFVKHLDSMNKAINLIIKKSDFHYIFNGVLQHSEPRYSKKLISDYTNGNLNYVFLKNLTLARHIKFLFKEYYKVVTVLNFPRMGSL